MRRLVITLIAALVVLVPATVAHAEVLKDVDDPFYRWDKPLDDVKPGTILRKRDISNPSLKGVPFPFKTSQVLYRTTKQSGAAIAVVATIMEPLLKNTTQLLSYQTAYDDLGSTCTPSYAIQGGDTSGVTPTLEPGFMAAYLAHGWTVVTSDYEGLTHDYTAGQGAGMATLDGIRAARAFLGVPDATPVGLLGYSGGATATQWASELAPQYSPETNIVGIAEGGIPVHYANIINYVDGTDSWGGVIPYVLVGLFRGADKDISRYLNDKGKEALKYVSDKCLDTDSFKAAHMSDFLKGNVDYKTIRPLVKVVNSQIMGTLGTPQAPILMATGVADGIGDGVMIAADTDALAHKYCQQGVPVTHRKFSGMDHIAAIVPFEAEAIAFLNARMNNIPVVNECATISTGRSLKPLPLPALPKLVVGRPWRTKAGYRIGVRVDDDYAQKVTVSLYSVKGTSRKRLATVRPDAELSTAPVNVTLPLKKGVKGRKYDVVVNAVADGDKVAAATSSFRVRR